MPGRFLGIGLLSAGCMAAAAGGGYLALRPAATEAIPEPTQSEPVGQVETVPIAPEAVLEPDLVPNVPDEKPVPPPAAVPLAERAIPAAVTKVTVPRSEPVALASPAEQPDAEPSAAATPASTVGPPLPLPPPVATPPVLPQVETATRPPVPLPTEPPRYVPDAPLPAVAAAQESSRFDVEELTIEKHSVIGIRLNSSISTKTARVEDRVSATVSRDVTVGGRTAIPADVRLEGTVTLVERGGRFKNRPRLGLRFDRMILADGTRVPITTDTIYREGNSPAANSTAKVGAGAVAGAILGAVFGGKKGAAIGGAAGAAGGAAAVMKEDAGETSLPAGAPLTVRLTEDLVVTINR